MSSVGFWRGVCAAILLFSVFTASADAQVLKCTVSESNGQGFPAINVGFSLQIQRASFVESSDGERLIYDSERDGKIVVSRTTGDFTWVNGDTGRFARSQPGRMSGNCKSNADKRLF